MNFWVSPKSLRIFWSFTFVCFSLQAGPFSQEKSPDLGEIYYIATAYFSDPSDVKAQQFYLSLPDSQIPEPLWETHEGGRTYHYIADKVSGLEKPIKEGHRIAVKLAFRLYVLDISAKGRLWRGLDMVLGDLIRVNPVLFLEEFRFHPLGTTKVLKHGWILCDSLRFPDLEKREAAKDVCEELEMRIKALRTVQVPELQDLKDESIKLVEKELVEKMEYIASHRAGTLASDVFEEFLSSPYLKDQRIAFNHIIGHKNEFLPRIFKRLEAWRDLHEDRTDHLDKLIYLSAALRDKRFLGILEEMLRSPNPGFDYDCIYDCPIVFACVLYAYFEGWSPPRDLDPTLTTTHDIHSGIGKYERISLERTRPGASGPGIDSHLEEALKLSQKDLIKSADPSNPNHVERLAAAFVLESSVADSKNLNDLYWLAINSVSGDFEYRGSIYWAIYRAEKARRAGR